MMRSTTQPAPTVRNAKRIPLPSCEMTTDTIIQQIIEGFPDRTRVPVEREPWIIHKHENIRNGVQA